MQDLFFKKNMTKFSAPFLLVAAMAILAGCGDSLPTTPADTVTATATLQLSAAPMTVKSDNSDLTTITVTAVSAGSATVPDATITLSADTGLLSASTVTTDATGTATATFSSGTVSKANRTATITATAGTATALLPVQIVGSTLILSATGSSLSVGGAAATLTITAKDAGGTPISGAAVALTPAGTGTVTLTPASGSTDANGTLTVSVAGATAGAVTVSADAVGATASTNFTVTASAVTTFGISLVTLCPSPGVPPCGTGAVPANPKTSAMQIGDSLAVRATAPAPTDSVIFATTIGTWTGACTGGSGLPVCEVTPVAGIATATLGSSVAGVASVQVVDKLNSILSDTLTVGITAKTAASISLQASPTVLPLSVGSTVGYSNLTAMVYDATGAPVGNAPVAFSIVAGTGTNSGEIVSPVVVFSAATTANGLDLGAAPATFTSGSLPSSAAGVQIRASVVGTTIATQSLLAPLVTTSSFDAAIVIGGQAGSVAFGQAAKIIDAGGASTVYTYPMSVLVADSNGSPAPLGTVVNISAWPIAWTTGSRGLGCDPDPDGFVWGAGTYVPGNGGTFLNEDANENLILDTGEDGVRKFYATGTATSAPPAPFLPYTVPAGTLNGQITPLNSWGGTVVSTNPADLPGTATTDATGLATFNLTFTKSSAFWVISRIRAQTLVQGTPAVGQLDVPLGASNADTDPVCYLPPSPFAF